MRKTGISTTLLLKDKFTNTLNKGAAGVQRMLKHMKELGVQSVKMNPAKMFSSVRSMVDKSTEGVRNFIQKQKEAAEGADKIKSSWGGMGGAIKSAIAAFGVKQAIGAVDTYASNSARLGLITKSLEEQKDIQEQIYQAAQRSRGSYNGMIDSVAKLGLLAGNAFSSNAEIVNFSELMQKSFSLSGADTGQISAGMLQLTQAMAAGRLAGDEYVSIMENAPMLIDAISKYTGKTKAELKALSGEGFITSDIIKASLFAAAGDIEGKFANMPKTFSSVWTQISNFAIAKFGGVMERINAFLNSATGSQIIAGIMTGISLLAMGVSGLFDLIERVGNSVTMTWSTIAPILQVAIPVAIGGIVGGMILWTVNAVKAGIATIAAMSPIVLTALAIGAAIGIVIAIAMKMGATFEQVCGFVGGVVGVLYAGIYNGIARIWNYFSSFAEFFANVFNHPVYSVKRLFVNFANTTLDVILRVAEAIDKVFGSNLAGNITSLQKQMDNWLGEMPEGYKVMKRLETKSYVDSAKSGYNMGANVATGISTELEKMFGGLDKLDAAFSTNGIKIDAVDTVNNIEKVNGDVDISEESLKLMKDVANMRYVQNFVTLTPTIAQNIGTVNQNADVNQLMSAAGEMLLGEVAAGAAGMY